MRIKVSLRDFINSKYHRDRTDYLDGILISRIRKRESLEKYGVDSQTIYPYSIARGKSEILKFLELDLGIEIVPGCDITLEFEDFSIWIYKQNDGRPKKWATVLCNVKKVWLPRKTDLQLTHYESFMIWDKYYGYYYVFPPNLMLPKKKADLWRFFQFLRFKKNLLLPDYVYGRLWAINIYSTFRYLKLEWGVFPKDAMPEVCIIMENTQPLIDEFVDWQNNRYRIIA